MIMIAFFFLLRPGKYTNSASYTTPFTLDDVQLFIGGRRLNIATSTAAELLTATFASFTFTRGEIIGLGLSGDSYLCCVRACARRVIHLWSHNAPVTTPLATAYYSNGTAHKIQPKHITKALKDCVTFLGADLGFLATDVTVRCLQAAGANALLLAKVDTNIIHGAQIRCYDTSISKQPLS